MKLLCERDALHRALGMVIGRAKRPNKAGIEILAHVKLVASDSRMDLTATDMAMRSESGCAAEIETPGALTVNADRFTRLVDLMPSGAQVRLDLQDNELHVRCGRSNYRLPTLDVDTFPQMSEPSDPVEFILTAAVAKRLFGETTAAISITGARRFLEGGCLHQDADGIAVVGTDGHRFVRLIEPSEIRFDGRYIVPKAAMSEIVKLAQEGDLAFRVGENLIEVKAKSCTLTSSLIDGTYPQIAGIIPALSANFIVVDRAEVVQALKRLCGIGSENSSIDLRWKEGTGELQMSISGEGSGSEIITCECDLAAGTISFVPAVLSEMLDVFNGDVLQLHITSAQKTMRIVDPAKPELTVLAAPCAPRVTGNADAN